MVLWSRHLHVQPSPTKFDERSLRVDSANFFAWAGLKKPWRSRKTSHWGEMAEINQITKKTSLRLFELSSQLEHSLISHIFFLFADDLCRQRTSTMKKISIFLTAQRRKALTLIFQRWVSPSARLNHAKQSTTFLCPKQIPLFTAQTLDTLFCCPFSLRFSIKNKKSRRLRLLFH